MYVVVVTSAFMGLAALTVALRLYTRVYVVKAPGLDDWIILGALVCLSIYLLCIPRQHTSLRQCGK